MTAEVAVLNNSAIALAADSAVTIGRQKIYNSAVKLFSLSKKAPVAAMIYGNAVLSGIPWEVIVKEYRRQLGGRTFDRVKDYSDDLLLFISRHPEFFSDDGDKIWLMERIGAYYSGLAEELKEKAEDVRAASVNKSITKQQIVSLAKQIIAQKIAILQKNQDLNPSAPALKRLRVLMKGATDTVAKHFFGDIHASLVPGLRTLGVLVVRKALFPGSSSGLVVAGFGDREIFPAIVTLEIDGAIKDFVRWRLDKNRTHTIGAENHAIIVPYAQEDMVQTFMEGINPSFNQFLRTYLKETFTNLPQELHKVFAKNTKNKSSLNELKRVCSEVEQKFVQTAQAHRMAEHVDPILRMVAVLPKDELAAMAESLVNLTAFKRRVTGTLETVGGPIDVCVISKGDGLVWVKRKHYFPKDLNYQFFQNYMS